MIARIDLNIDNRFERSGRTHDLRTGIHGCVGRAAARLESEATFGALAKRVASFQLMGESTRRRNNTLRGFNTLPFRTVPV
jgi:cytochrome P450